MTHLWELHPVFIVAIVSFPNRTMAQFADVAIHTEKTRRTANPAGRDAPARRQSVIVD